MTSELSHRSILSKNPNVVGHLVEHEVVLILLDKNQVKVLNEVGSRIWDLLNGQRSVGEIACVIVEEFEVEIQQSLDDVLVFLEELVQKGIVIVCPQE